MKKIVSLLFANIIFTTVTVAQSSPTSAVIYLGLRKLNVLGSVLYVAAHPDDENTRLLTYFSKDKLYRTGYLSITRGDGGQNLIGDEQGIELGLIRTQELLAARRTDGAEQYFTRAYDFGYSKTPEETFAKWDKEKVLADVVWVIRQTRPDVIITRFPTTGEGGHGHHTASAILANEAFIAAADPKSFPEQLKWVQPWQAKRILWNAFNFGGNNTTRDDQFRFDVGGYNPVLGKSYGEIAADSRSQHKSQGFGVPRSRGEALEYFKATSGTQPATDLFEEVPTGWERVKGGEAIGALIQQSIASFDFLAPQKSVPQLVKVYKNIKGLPQSFWRDQKLKETATLIEQASGLWLDAFTSEPFVAQTDSARISLSLNNRLGANIIVNKVSGDAIDTVLNTPLGKNKNLNMARTVFVPLSKGVTQPYWLKDKMNEGYFNVADQSDIGRADVQPAFITQFHLNIEGEEFVFERPVRYRYTDPVRGELYQPFVVFPAVTVNTQPSLVIQKKEDKALQQIILTAKANKSVSFSKAVAELRLTGNQVSALDSAGQMSKNTNHQYSVRLPAVKRSQDIGLPFVRYDSDTMANYLALSSIKYDHIPHINYFYTDAVKVLNIDLKTVGKRIGYIVGAGDKVPDALESMGYDVILLTDKELSRNNLKQFDAIISGVRAYNTNEWLNNHYSKLMNYVEGGGNFIVQYNTSNNIGPVRAKIGPYNFTISRNRITDETAAVTFLKPQHQVLHFPNAITQADFNDWVQERSIYHATASDPKFETIFSMNDAGEKGDDGSLIIAKHGKGYFTYTGLVFFRELPAGVPGAYRLLANLIALNQKKEM